MSEQQQQQVYPSLNRAVTQRRRRHPWDQTYNRRCLKSGCQFPTYHDGQTYFSLCLKHLESEKLGPFFKQKSNNQSA